MAISNWLGLTLTALVACADHAAPQLRRDVPRESAATHPSSTEDMVARARVDELQRRFVVRTAWNSASRGKMPSFEPVIQLGTATKFRLDPDHMIRPVLPANIRQPVGSTASVELPQRASGSARVRDDRSQLSIAFQLRGASDVEYTSWAGLVLYPRAFEGFDIVQRVDFRGIEDFIVFERRPSREEVAYEIDVSRVAGLRLVENTLEFLDQSSTPRLRVAPPYVMDARGRRHGAKMALRGCAADRNPAAPWDRAVVPPGAPRCTLIISWRVPAYPAVLDPAWTTTGTMAQEHHQHTATALLDGKVLMAGGSIGNGSAYAELYDPTSGTFGATGSMVQGRRQHAASLLLSGHVLVVSGWGSGIFPLGTSEVYDPATGTFSPKGSTIARRSHTATLLTSGKVLVAGGANYLSEAHASTELYDPTTGTFSQAGLMKSARQQHAAVRLASGEVLLVGGFNDPDSAEIYSPQTGTFTITGSMATDRVNPAVALLPTGQVVVAGGSMGAAPLSSAEIYDPTLGTFQPTNPMLDARTEHAVAFHGSGRLLIAGGWGGAELASAEMYDIATGEFISAGLMNEARTGHSAITLPSGKVLIAGGYKKLTAELFDTIPVGSACTGDGECVSGACDGNCCAGACSSPCMSCSPGTGACVPVTGKDDPHGCTGTMTCDAVGLCKSKVGQPCEDASDCASGNCADGFCCNKPCTGQCEACDVSFGSCIAVFGAPRGNRPPCEGTTEACQGTCDGYEPSTCTYPGSSVVCAPGSCKSGVSQPASKCDGNGSCSAPEVIDCTPYDCDDATGSCRSSCDTDHDCMASYICAGGACVSSSGGMTGSGGASGTAGNGAKGGGANAGGPGTESSSDSSESGCGCRASGRTARSSLLLAVAIAVAGAARRRKAGLKIARRVRARVS